MENLNHNPLIDSSKDHDGELTLDDTFLANEDVEDILITIEGLKVQIKHLNDQKESEEKILIGIIKETTTKIVNAKGHTLATWSFFPKNRFDTKKFQADYPDLYAAYCRSDMQRRWDIKRREV